jgi:hypothetical protein
MKCTFAVEVVFVLSWLSLFIYPLLSTPELHDALNRFVCSLDNFFFFNYSSEPTFADGAVCIRFWSMRTISIPKITEWLSGFARNLLSLLSVGRIPSLSVLVYYRPYLTRSWGRNYWIPPSSIICALHTILIRWCYRVDNGSCVGTNVDEYLQNFSGNIWMEEIALETYKEGNIKLKWNLRG